MSNMKIAIAGAGAMGSRFGYMLSSAGNDVVLIDQWKDHVEAIRQNGLQINWNGEERVAQIPVYFPNEVHNEDFSLDLVFLFTKAMQLDGMLQELSSSFTDNTKVVCLLNGMGYEDTLLKYVKKENIFIGNTMWTAGMEGPGKIKLFGIGTVELQEMDPTGLKNAQEIAELLDAAGLCAKHSGNVIKTIYKKLCVNGTMNGLCTILDVNMAELGLTQTAKDICEKLVKEIIAVAKEEGVTLDLEESLEQVHSCFNPETIGMHYPSMYQDLMKNNRKTEVDFINGAVAKKGKKYGIATPYNDFLTDLVKAKEDALKAM